MNDKCLQSCISKRMCKIICQRAISLLCSLILMVCSHFFKKNLIFFQRLCYFPHQQHSLDSLHSTLIQFKSFSYKFSSRHKYCTAYIKSWGLELSKKTHILLFKVASWRMPRRNKRQWIGYELQWCLCTRIWKSGLTSFHRSTSTMRLSKGRTLLARSFWWPLVRRTPRKWLPHTMWFPSTI